LGRPADGALLFLIGHQFRLAQRVEVLPDGHGGDAQLSGQGFRVALPLPLEQMHDRLPTGNTIRFLRAAARFFNGENLRPTMAKASRIEPLITKELTLYNHLTGFRHRLLFFEETTL